MKLLYPSLHKDPTCGCGAVASNLGIVWPDLPFACPGCNVPQPDHVFTVATVDPERPSETTFRCLICELVEFSRTLEGPPLASGELIRRWGEVHSHKHEAP